MKAQQKLWFDFEGGSITSSKIFFGGSFRIESKPFHAERRGNLIPKPEPWSMDIPLLMKNEVYEPQLPQGSWWFQLKTTQ